ncbi:transglutaminase-like cysteine peptidase [Curvibacter sp. RS43]|uniref:transglutaminase-like cysteine peptidase n=1 Tax=Curvibacter microcysteis TaxID=3026419 RepID=UPI00235FF0DC|nr:transglutaminase-like cysteine peptidase [Curvibacter sp. RS43]MDD0809480.1 transglutaminase-like cysteine peptidase [Curvibacter sp. RS43]
MPGPNAPVRHSDCPTLPWSAGQRLASPALRRWVAAGLASALALVLALGAWTWAQAGVVDFSRNLLSWADRQWGPDAPARLLTWQRIVRDSLQAKEAGRMELTSQLARSNDFFNQVPYYSDRQHWGMDDYWATPVELLGSLGGDCEDYAVAKYLMLKELGVPIERLRITYVRALRLNEAHMVLAYYPTPDADPLILDNLNPVIRPASQRTDLEPVYSFNDDDLWLANGLTRKGGSSQVRLWKDMLAKMAREQQM